MQNTSKQYDEVIHICKSLFIKKMKDYGSAWRILRLPSLTDQIFIKAQRIRSLQQNAVQKVDEGEVSEFIGIINYCIDTIRKGRCGTTRLIDRRSRYAIRRKSGHN